MDRTEIIERLKNIAEHAVHTVGERPFIMSLDDGIAVHEAIELLEKAETNCPEIPDSWIPVSKKLPEEKINPNTHDFEEVLCSTTFGDVRAYKFGTPYGWEKPHFWLGLNVMDEYVLAWMEKPEPWKGEQHETD